MRQTDKQDNVWKDETNSPWKRVGKWAHGRAYWSVDEKVDWLDD